MKIAILAAFPLHELETLGESYRPPGHFATWLPQLARAFRKFPELEIHWVLLSDRMDEDKRLEEHGQVFHVLTTATGYRATTLFWKDRRKIRGVLQEIKPDLVHGWGTEDVYALATVTSGMPHLVSMQGILTHYVFQTRMPLRNYVQALLEAYVLRRADRVSVESTWGRDVVQKQNRRLEIDLVEYGVQDHFFDIEWKPDPAKPKAIFIGSVTGRKGIEDAVTAFGDSRLAGAELQVAGDGDQEAALREVAPPNVTWLGRLTAQEAALKLGQAWCLVLPTRADTSPNVVKEARVVGLPVITTPDGGQRDYIFDGENGFLVPPGETDSLADRLHQILSDRSTCLRLGQNRWNEQREYFRPENTAAKFVEIYRKMEKHHAG